MPKIELINVTKRWNNFYAVENLNLVVEDNAFVTLLGPSGCGKTTTLRMIAGLETPTEGIIKIGDDVVFDSSKGINIPANKRRIGFLFQNYALWPNMTVYQNIAFGLTNIKEEMYIYDYKIKQLRQLINALDRPKKIAELINLSKNKKEKIDTKKVYLKLMDTFGISIYTAKILYSINPKMYNDYKEKLYIDLYKRIEKYQKKNISIDEESRLVVDNVLLKKERKLNAEEIDLLVRKVSKVVKVGMFMDRYPSELSGGQQQRVAIARTLAPEPKVLFMDEPLSNLDAKLRLEMRYELQRLHIETGSTFVYVTHDQMEAMTLATKICLLNNGLLQQYDVPLEVYNKPINTFVADFVGNPSINFLNVKGVQSLDGSIDIKLFGKLDVKFKPNESINLNDWFNKRNELENKLKLASNEKNKCRGYVEKGNKDELFKHKEMLVNDDNEFMDDEQKVLDGDFVIGIRPEFVIIDKKGLIDGEIYGAMPTGMESTMKIKVDNFLLTNVIFGGITYPLGKKIKLSFHGNNIALFDRVSGLLITTGSIEL